MRQPITRFQLILFAIISLILFIFLSQEVKKSNPKHGATDNKEINPK